MHVFKYSGPEFNPFGDEGLIVGGEPGPWPAPIATGPLSARLALPGSKSLTNRELVLSAIASGPSILRAPLHSRDTALMIVCVLIAASVAHRPHEACDGVAKMQRHGFVAGLLNELSRCGVCRER